MLDEKDRRIMVGWMGLPDIGYPTDSHGWAHCLTLPRMLTFHEGRLIQQPVPELQTPRDHAVEAADTLHSEVKSYEGSSRNRIRNDMRVPSHRGGRRWH